MSRVFRYALLIGAGIAIGLLIGRAGSNHSASTRHSATQVPRSTIDYVPPAAKFTAAQVESHRETHYADMTSVDEVISLPTDFSQTEALFAMAGRADIDSIRQYIEEAENIVHRWDRRAALQILFLRYIEIDPVDAVDYLHSMQLDIDVQIIDQMFQAWSKVDLNAAIDAVNGISNTRRRKAAGTAVLRAYAQTDPGMLVSVERSLIDTYDLDEYQAEALAVSANYSPKSALQEALSMNGAQVRMRAIASIGHVWARQDPQSALANADMISDPQLRQTFRNAVLSRWASDDPDTAVQLVLGMTPGHERDQLIAIAMNSLGSSNPQVAMGIADQLGGHARDMAYQSIFATWANSDPRAAVRGLADLANAPLKEQLMDSVAYQYAQRYPDEALQWAKGLEGRRSAGIFERVVTQMARSNPQKAIEAALQSGSDPRSAQVLSDVLAHVAQSQPQLAASYVDQLPQGNARDMALGQIASQWASTDPDAALTWIGGLSGDIYQNAMSQVAQNIAWRDPDKAAGFVARVSGDARSAWIRSVAESYAHRDPQRALAWVNQYKGEPAYDAAILRIVPQLAEQQPVAALNLAQSLQGDARQAATQRAIHQWAANDPAAAARWAATSAAPAERGQALRTVADNWLRYDRHSATQWALGLPAGAERDQVLATVVSHNAHGHEQQMALIDAIASTEQRDRAIATVYMNMANENPAAASVFLDRSGISEEFRRRLAQYQPPGH